ncbi:MAG: hypothetical protein AB7S36_18695, partial [Planctomycetota bacterium]
MAFPFFKRRTRTDVYLVGDGHGWASDNNTKDIRAAMIRRGLSCECGTDPSAMRRGAVLYVSRYALVHKRQRAVIRRNRAYVIWFHGDPADVEFAALFGQVMERLPQMQKLITSCRITLGQLQHAGVPPAQLALVPLGVDLQQYRPATADERAAMRAKLGISPDALVVGSFMKDGSGFGDGMEAKPIKGPDALVRTLTQLHARFPSLVALLSAPARGYVKQRLDEAGVPYRHVVAEGQAGLATL